MLEIINQYAPVKKHLAEDMPELIEQVKNGLDMSDYKVIEVE